jgi:hypothetical protein
MTATAITYENEPAWSKRCEPVRVETQEVRYLDMSGDGVPDAVERVQRRTYRNPVNRLVDIVEETRRLTYGIGINGRPGGVAERTTVFERNRVAAARRDIPPW